MVSIRQKRCRWKNGLDRLDLCKDNGLVKDVFQAHHTIELREHVSLELVKYPTAGSTSCAEAQPLYTNYQCGICVAHNGNLMNTGEFSIKVQKKFQVGRGVSCLLCLLLLFLLYLCVLSPLSSLSVFFFSNTETSDHPIIPETHRHRF